VPRHIRTEAVETYMTAATFADTTAARPNLSTRQPTLPERSTRFSIVVGAHTDADYQRGWISGIGDLYEIGALISVQAAERLTAGEVYAAGVVSPAEAFDEAGLLEALLGMRFIHGGLQTETIVTGHSTPPSAGTVSQ